jgi:hypothetical protein
MWSSTWCDEGAARNRQCAASFFKFGMTKPSIGSKRHPGSCNFRPPCVQRSHVSFQGALQIAFPATSKSWMLGLLSLSSVAR